MRAARGVVSLFLFFHPGSAPVWSGSGVTAQQKVEGRHSQKLRQEEKDDYYRKWLKEDVVYIITPEELAVFEKLTTGEEKEQFIEQFWRRRDPDLRTSINEFQEEHYRRIAYVNERFSSGVPGWKTDRGRVYIIHGPPAEIEQHKSGESYQRPPHEGGGMTTTFPFEIWRYRHIEGIGPDVELEFVDPSGSGEFRLARNPWEKDAMLFTPGAGLTEAEALGLAQRSDRPHFSPATADTYPAMHLREKDTPFTRYQTLVQIQAPPLLKYNDLKEIVNINVGYNDLPFKVRQDFFRLNQERVLVPITLELENKNLSFTLENGVYVARVAVYGIVTSMTNRVISEFEDDLLVSYQPRFFADGLLGLSLYQKVVSVEGKMRYRVDLVVKDLKSEKIGATRQGIIPPAYAGDQLSLSSLILSDYARPLKEIPAQEMFIIGDVKIRPSLDQIFSAKGPLWVYLHVYNAALDQTTLSPSLFVTYRIGRDGKRVMEIVEKAGESVQFYSGQRVVLLQSLPVEGLRPDLYQLQIEVQDQISGERTSVHTGFELIGADHAR